jgi:hypothetical protein
MLRVKETQDHVSKRHANIYISHYPLSSNILHILIHPVVLSHYVSNIISMSQLVPFCHIQTPSSRLISTSCYSDGFTQPANFRCAITPEIPPFLFKTSLTCGETCAIYTPIVFIWLAETGGSKIHSFLSPDLTDKPF